MQLIRYREGEGVPQVGVLDGDRVPAAAGGGDHGRPAGPAGHLDPRCLPDRARRRALPGGTWPGHGPPDQGEAAGTIPVSGSAQAASEGAGTVPREVPLRRIKVLAPVDGGTEVWAAGVTYERSMHARVEESRDSADIYDRVYTAPRPELFFKSRRVAGRRSR